MPPIHEQFLDRIIAHLERLRHRGRRFVPVSPPAISESVQPAVQPAAAGGDPTPEPVKPGAVPAAPIPGATAKVPTESPAPSPTARPAATIDPHAREVAMTELRERALICIKCPNLAASRNTVVFGVGDIQSPLMFVGEAPGADEDAQGEPFVGKAGQLLTRIITTMGMSRETVYIANILKCRPDTPGQDAGNRKPTPAEMRTCLPYLQAQIDLIQPKVIVALGATAVEGLLGKTQGITRLRGHWQTFQNIALMPTYHPAFLLRNQALSEKRKVWEDMLQVLEKLGHPISDRQRGYFLKA